MPRDGRAERDGMDERCAARGTAVPRRHALLAVAGLVVLAGCDDAHTDPAGRRPVPKESETQPGVCTSGPAPEPQYYVHQGPKTIALTIDDGPDPRYTPDVLAVLASYGVTATFCMVGQSAAAHPDLVRQVTSAGHLLANHTWSHPDNLASLSDEQVKQEIEQATQTIQDTAGIRPVFFRAPGGAFTSAVRKACALLGLQPLAWSVDPTDWATPGTAHIVSTVLKATRTGSIILNHDGGGDRTQTVAALRVYLPRLLNAGYRFTTPLPSQEQPSPHGPCP